MCDFMAGAAEIVGPGDDSGRVYRVLFWLVMAAIFFGGMYWAVGAGFFG